MVNNPKATIISVYFGNLPSFFAFTKKTILHNKDYQWIIAGDMFDEKIEEGNILFLPFTLKNLSEECSRVLNTDIEIKTPYKTCDARPLFPEIFENYIHSDWVGWGDLDCIFGDLNSFITQDVLINYDIFTYLASSVYNLEYKTPHGPFTLLNNKKIKGWYLKINDLIEKINYLDPTSKDLRASSKYLDEDEFGKIIHEEKYKVYSRHKPYPDKDIDLPVIFNGRRRVPAKWIDGKIFIDSLKEDYNGKFDDLHSLFVHIRGDVVVDIENNEVVPGALFLYKNKNVLKISSHRNVFNFIKEVIPTLKYLYYKNKNIIFSFERQNYKNYKEAIEIVAPEIQINFDNNDKINDLTKTFPLTQIPPFIFEDIRKNIQNKNFPKENNLFLNKTLSKKPTLDIKTLSLSDLLSIFCHSNKIISDLNLERDLIILMPDCSTYTDFNTEKTDFYLKTTKQLFSLTMKKITYSTL